MGKRTLEDFSILDQYQREGYHALMRIAHRYNGALLCDGVGWARPYRLDGD